MLSNIKAILFDMDGVIFDSERIYYEACFMATKQNNIEISHDFVTSFAGKSSPVCQLMLKDFLNGNTELTKKIWNDWEQARYHILDTQGVMLKDGITELLDYLANTELTIGLVTSASKLAVSENFSHVTKPALTNFDPIITVEQVRYPKPNPEPYLLALQKTGINCAQTIVIEDSHAGASAAIAAGCNTILLSELPDLIAADKLLIQASSHAQILDYFKSNGI